MARQSTPPKKRLPEGNRINQVALFRLLTGTIEASGFGHSVTALFTEFLRCPVYLSAITDKLDRIFRDKRITSRGLRPASLKLTMLLLSQTSNRRPVSRSPDAFQNLLSPLVGPPLVAQVPGTHRLPA
jgi:hypothetical protein